MIKVSILYPTGETDVSAASPAQAARAARSGDGLTDVGINAEPSGTPPRDISRSTRRVRSGRMRKRYSTTFRTTWSAAAPRS